MRVKLHSVKRLSPKTKGFVVISHPKLNPYQDFVYLYEHLLSTSSWLLSASQRELYSSTFCIWADPLQSNCMRLWMNVYFNIHWSGYSTVWLQMAGARWNCCCLGACSVDTMQQLTMSLCSKPQKQGACMVSCNLPSAFSAEWLGSFTCNCGNRGVERILK